MKTDNMLLHTRRGRWNKCLHYKKALFPQ